jgi:hypothetical protein
MSKSVSTATTLALGGTTQSTTQMVNASWSVTSALLFSVEPRRIQMVPTQLSPEDYPLTT